METLKFLMVSTHYPPHHLGGDAVFVSMLSEELLKAGHEVEVFYNPKVHEFLSKNRPATPQPDSPSGLVRNPYHPIGGSVEMFAALSLGRWKRALGRLRESVARTKPDVVHWHNTRGFIGAPVELGRAINLLTAHDYATVCPKSNLLKPDMSICEDPRWCTFCSMRSRRPFQLWRAGRKRVMSIPKNILVLAPSQFLAKRLAEDGVPVHKVLRNFVPDMWAKEADYSGEKDLFLYLGIVEKHKGVKTLVEAFDKSKDGQGFKLVLVGQGSQRDSIMKRIERGGLAGRISIPGYLSHDQVVSTRRRAAAQAIPSEWLENAPLSAIESLSMGVPLIASDIGGLPEIADDESGSWRFPPGDSVKLAEILVSVWEERDRLEKVRRLARLAYEAKYNPQTHLKQYLAIVSGAVRD